MNVTSAHRPPPTILFTIRLWPEEIDAGQFEWRGEVKKIASGQTHYFRDWQTLVHLMTQMLNEDPLALPPVARIESSETE